MKKCRYIKNTFKQYYDCDGIHYYVGIRKLICSYDQFGRMARSNTGEFDPNDTRLGYKVSRKRAM